MTLLSFRKTFIGAAAALAIGGAGVASAFNGVNLLSNGTFDTNVNGWGHHAGFPAASVEFHKGTAKVTNLSNLNTATHGAAVQCVNNVSKGTYALSFNAYIPSAQGRDGGAKTRIFWYDGANCTGPVLESPQGPKLLQEDTWLSSESSFTAPAGASSAEIFIIAIKDTPKPAQLAAAPFVVHFDNVKFGKPVVIVPPTNTPVPPTNTPVPPQPTQAPQQPTQVPQQPTQVPTQVPQPPTQQPTQVPQPPTQQPTQVPQQPTTTPQQPTTTPGGTGPSTPTTTPAGDSGSGGSQDQPSGGPTGGGQPSGPTSQPGGSTGGTTGGGTSGGGGTTTPAQPQVSDSNPPSGQGSDVDSEGTTGQDAPLPPNTGSGNFDEENGDSGLMLVLIALVAGVGAGAATVGAVKSRRS